MIQCLISNSLWTHKYCDHGIKCVVRREQTDIFVFADFCKKIEKGTKARDTLITIGKIESLRHPRKKEENYTHQKESAT
jgi:hypothetical protein